MKALEVGEFDIILRVVAQGVKRDAALRDTVGVLLMHDAGLRVAEACGVTAMDFTADMKHLCVRGEIAKHRDAGDDQVVSVSPRTREAVAAWVAVRGRTTGPLLVTGRGRPVHPHHYNALLARISAGYLNRHVHPHMLRHSCATVLACDAKLPLPIAQAQLRHRNIATTNAYLKVRPEWGDDVAAAFG